MKSKSERDSKNSMTSRKLSTSQCVVHSLQHNNATHGLWLVDCEIDFSSSDNKVETQCPLPLYYSLRKKLKERNFELKGKITKIVGKDMPGFDNSDVQNTKFNFILFLKYNTDNGRLYISDQGNHIIRSMINILINDNNEWNGRLENEVGQPEQEGYSNGDRNTCRLKFPKGFDWDMNDNMYICNSSCICKVDSVSNQVSLVAGHANDKGFKDGNNNEARFNVLAGVTRYQQNYQSPLLLFACDCFNNCIRMIDVTNGKTTTFAGKGEVYDDADGTLQSARFYWPWDIRKDDENVDYLYVSDSVNHKIKLIDMKIGMVTTFAGDKNNRSILGNPQQMEILDPYIYVVSGACKDLIFRIDKYTKQVIKITIYKDSHVNSGIYGIIYHELNQCFYINDKYSIYKLE